MIDPISGGLFDFTGAFNAEPHARLGSGVTHETMSQCTRGIGPTGTCVRVKLGMG
jgi:hypothetical protein